MIGDEDLPLLTGQPPASLAQHATGVKVAFLAGPAVDIRAGIGRVGQRRVHRVVGRLDPGDLRRAAAQVPGGLQRPAQALLAQPQPGGPHRPAHREPVEDRSDDTGDRLVGVPADLPVMLAPDQPDRQAAAQLPAGCLVADPALQPCAQHVELRLAHDPFHAEHQPVVEQAGVVYAVGVGNQRVAGSGQIQQPVPGGVVPGQPGDLQRQDDPDLTQRHVGHQRLEPVASTEDRAGHAEVGVDDPDRAARPAQLDGAFGQVVLPGGGLAVAFELGQGGLADIDDRDP